jgi:hypothetical protein
MAGLPVATPASTMQGGVALFVISGAQRLDSIGGRLRPSYTLGVQAEHDDYAAVAGLS